MPCLGPASCGHGDRVVWHKHGHQDQLLWAEEGRKRKFSEYEEFLGHLKRLLRKIRDSHLEPLHDAQGLSSKTRSWNRRQHGRVWLTLKMLELSAGTGTGLSINDTKPASPFVYALIPRDEGEKGTFLNLPEGQALHGCQCRRGWKPSSHRPRSVAPPCCNFSLMLFTRSSY